MDNAPVILIPAAGASARMRGRDKLLEPVEGAPLLARQARMAADTGHPVLVTLPSDAEARAAALRGVDGICIEEVAEAAEGIAASLRAGASWARARRAGALMVVLADLPELRTGDLNAVIRAHAAAPERVVRATDAQGTPGHPVILPARLFAALEGVTGDAGAGALLRGEEVTALPLPGRRATTDLDTPEAWAAWRARGEG